MILVHKLMKIHFHDSYGFYATKTEVLELTIAICKSASIKISANLTKRC